MESLNVVNDQTNVTTPSPTKSRYLDLAQQRQLQTPARPEPEEKRQVPDMEPIWQETTAKQKLNAQLRNRVSEPNTVEPQANDKEESEVIDEIQSPPVQEQVAEPTENVVNEPQPEVITVQAVQMDIKPTKAVPVQKQAPQIDTKPSKADPERKQALDNFLRPTSPPRQSKTDRSAATDLSYNSKFYLPEKYSMPKRVKPSVNTTFVRMRQNDEGTIVMLPKVASADFFAFKNSLREGVDVQPIPYERLNEIIPGFTNQIADQLKEELSTTHPSKTIQSESKILGNMYPVNAEEEVKVKQPVKERKSPSPKKRSQSPASQPAFIQQDVTPSGDNFTKGDIQELKALSKPPVAVKDVVSMVCILTTGNLNPDWQSCQKMLNNPNEFVKQLKEFDVGNITEEQIAKCRKVIGTNLTPDSVRSVSRAASGMFEWVCSIVGLPEQAPAQVRVKKPVEKTKRQKSPSPAKAPKRPQQETESIFDADPSGDARRQHVTRGDITELKSLPNPPEAVKETLQIVCILLTGNLKPEWADCKKLIANPA